VIALAILVLMACDSAGAATVENDWLAHEHEVARLQHILAADFVHVLPTGQFITKSEHIGYVASHPAPAGFEAHFERLDIRLVSGVAIATGIVSTTEHRMAFTDIFACREGRWQAVGAQETPLANTSR
jgi:hypothetical protein